MLITHKESRLQGREKEREREGTRIESSQSWYRKRVEKQSGTSSSAVRIYE